VECELMQGEVHQLLHLMCIIRRGRD